MARPDGTKYIEVDELQKIFEEYVSDIKGKPFLIDDWVGGVAKPVTRKKEKPLTMEGFRVYCFRKYSCVKQYFDNPKNRYEDYITICSHIRDIIRQDQIEGGMAGLYNPSITQRLNGLVDKIEQTNFEQPLFQDVPKNDSDKQNPES